jgi:hypothetical protein
VAEPPDPSPTSALRRRHLRAGLAARRAELLWQLVGLDAETLASDPVTGDWTATDVLAHVAWWDEVYRERVEADLAGQKASTLRVGREASSQSSCRDRGEWGFEAALAAFLAARRAFLDTLALVPDDRLHVPGERPGPVESSRTWAERVCRHDAFHARQLARWWTRRGLLEGVGPKSLLTAAVRAARKELLTAVALVSLKDREIRPLGNGQTLYEVLVQVADQEQDALDVVRVRNRASGVQTALTSDDHTSARSSRHVMMRGSWHQMWRKLHDTHQQLLLVLARMDQAQLEYPLSADPDIGVAARRDLPDTVYACFRLSAAHDREQAAVIRAAAEIVSDEGE